MGIAVELAALLVNTPLLDNLSLATSVVGGKFVEEIRSEEMTMPILQRISGSRHSYGRRSQSR